MRRAFTLRVLEGTIDAMTSSSKFSILRVLGATGLGLALIAVAIPYLAARNERARREIEDTREAARFILEASNELSDMEIIGQSLLPLGKDLAISFANMASSGKIRALREAAGEARDCMSEIGRNYHWYELIYFSLPVDCRSMYAIIVEATEAGHAHISAPTPTPTPTPISTDKVSLESVRGPRHDFPVLETNSPPLQEVPPKECRRWEIKAVKFTVPPQKANGKAWDSVMEDSDPDPSLTAVVSGRAAGTWYGDENSFRFSKSVLVFASPDDEVELSAYDRDQLDDDDWVFSTSFIIQDVVKNDRIQSGDFEVTVRCRR